MNKLKLALCDEDEIYCHRLDEFFHKNLTLTFDISSFTDVAILCDAVKENPVSLLIISENLFHKLQISAQAELFTNVLVLDEGMEAEEASCAEPPDGMRIKHVMKYQAASKIVDGIIDFCVEHPDEFGGARLRTNGLNSSIYGFFAPIKRCGQTSLARGVAQKLAEKGKTVYLSFESFSSLPYLLGALGGEDITDLFYFAECERAKISLFLEKMKVSRDGVDYILPARTSMQLREISLEKMKDLLEILSSDAGYEYVVLDMTDYPEEFLDILLLCKKIITITRANPVDDFKQKQFEAVLRDSGYEEICLKTTKLMMPDLRDKRSLDACIKEIVKGEEL